MSDDHDQHADRAAAYVLGSLSPADAEAFEFHLVECDRCTDAVAALLEGGGLLDAELRQASDRLLADEAAAAAAARAGSLRRRSAPSPDEIDEVAGRGGAAVSEVTPVAETSTDPVASGGGSARRWLAVGLVVALLIAVAIVVLG